jgi:LPXTG-motif cell wall-anchored protein
MESSMFQVISGALAVLLLGVIVMRRRSKANS